MADSVFDELRRSTGSPLPYRVLSALAVWLLVPPAMWPKEGWTQVPGFLAIVVGLLVISAYYLVTLGSTLSNPFALIRHPRDWIVFMLWFLWIPLPPTNKRELQVFYFLLAGALLLVVAILKYSFSV